MLLRRTAQGIQIADHRLSPVGKLLWIHRRVLPRHAGNDVQDVVVLQGLPVGITQRAATADDRGDFASQLTDLSRVGDRPATSL